MDSPNILYLHSQTFNYKPMKILFSLALIPLLFACSNPENPSQTETLTQTEESTKNQSNTKTYCNNRFQFCLEYDAHLLEAQAESQNGDGRTFTDVNEQEILTVFGRLAMDFEGETITLKEQFQEDLKGGYDSEGYADREVTYQKFTETYYVISGYQRGKIFYQKTILKDDAFCFAILNYSKGEKETYQATTALILKTFQ